MWIYIFGISKYNRIESFAITVRASCSGTVHIIVNSVVGIKVIHIKGYSLSIASYSVSVCVFARVYVCVSGCGCIRRMGQYTIYDVDFVSLSCSRCCSIRISPLKNKDVSQLNRVTVTGDYFFAIFFLNIFFPLFDIFLAFCELILQNLSAINCLTGSYHGID